MSSYADNNLECQTKLSRVIFFSLNSRSYSDGFSITKSLFLKPNYKILLLFFCKTDISFYFHVRITFLLPFLLIMYVKLRYCFSPLSQYTLNKKEICVAGQLND